MSYKSYISYKSYSSYKSYISYKSYKSYSSYPAAHGQFMHKGTIKICHRQLFLPNTTNTTETPNPSTSSQSTIFPTNRTYFQLLSYY